MDGEIGRDRVEVRMAMGLDISRAGCGLAEVSGVYPTKTHDCLRRLPFALTCHNLWSVANLLQHVKTIPQRELRNRISQVLRSVERGERMQITVDGRPVAELGPVGGRRRTFVPRDEVLSLLSRASLDRKFERDLRAVDATIDEL